MLHNPLVIQKSLYFSIGLAMLVATLAVYFPFRNDIEIVYRFMDGPLYAYNAKFFYQVPEDHPMGLVNFPATYYAAHLPLTSVLIRSLVPVTCGNYLLAMLLAMVMASVASALLFLRVLQVWNLVESPGWTALLFCFLPPTWLIYHSVGASEPLFLVFCFASLLSYKSDRPFLVAVFICLATWTRITGILLVPIFLLAYFSEKQWRSMLIIAPASLSLPALFLFYYFSFGDFFAFFHASPDKVTGSISLVPLSAYLAVVGSNWMRVEYFVYFYLLNAAGTLFFYKRNQIILIYCAVFFLFNIFIIHDHIGRFFINTMPFTLLVAYDKLFSAKAFRWLLPLILFLSYTYAWGQIPNNLAVPEFFAKVASDLHIKSSPAGDDLQSALRFQQEGVNLYFAGKFGESIEASMKSLQFRPDKAEVYNNVCAAYNDLGQWEEAIQACSKALELQPDFDLARNNLELARRMSNTDSGQQ